MAGFANLFYLGQPDPEQQLARLLSGQQQPGQQPPQGPAPPGATPPAPGGPGAAPAPPQPQAYQSPPDLAAANQQLANPPNIMSLMVQMDQRNRAEDAINRGLAGLVANHSPPSMRQSIMQSIGGGGGGDAGQSVGNLMSLYQMQTQMAAQQQLLKQAPEIDKRNNWPDGTAAAEIMAGRGAELIKSMEPTDLQRNYDWARRNYAANHPGASPEEIDQGAQGVLLGAGGMGGGDAATKSWRMAKIQWDQNPATKGTPYPWGSGADDNPTGFASWQGAQKAEETKQAEDQTEAANKLPTYVQNLTGARKKLTDILGVTGVDDQGHPVMDPDREALLKSIIGNPFAQSYIDGKPGVGREWTAWWTGLSDPQKQVLTDIKEATDPETLIGGLNKRAPKRGTADVSDISTGLSGMRDVTKGYGHWVQGALGTIGAIDTATANGFGASGQPGSAPENVKDLIDPTYLFGGKLYPKGQRPLPIPADQLASAQQQIKSAADPEDMRQKLITHFRARNFDPTPLKGQ